MLLTLALSTLPLLQEPQVRPAAPPAKGIAQQEAAVQDQPDRRAKDFKDLSDAEYYRALQIVQKEAKRRGDAELAAGLGQRLATMEGPALNRNRDAKHSRDRVDEVRDAKPRRVGDAGPPTTEGAPGEPTRKEQKEQYNKERLEGKQSKEARIAALQRQIDQLEAELARRQNELAALQADGAAQPDANRRKVRPSSTEPAGRPANRGGGKPIKRGG